MDDPATTLSPAAQVWRTLASHGLRPWAVVSAQPEDAWPALGHGRSADGLALIGALGGSAWASFSGSSEVQDGGPDPLDRWSRRLGDAAAEGLGGVALYPFDGPPHWPFQAWVLRAGVFMRSPLGLLIHPDHGLWVGFRFALLLPDLGSALSWAVPDASSAHDAPSPCASCIGRPCLSACPVRAHSEQGFDLARCLAGLAPGGASPACLGRGCLARLACPVGAAHAHPPAQAAFHMQAFVAACSGPPAAPGGHAFDASVP